MRILSSLGDDIFRTLERIESRVYNASEFYLRSIASPVITPKSCVQFEKSSVQFHAIARNGIAIGNPNRE